MSLTKHPIGIVVLAVAVSYYASSAFVSDNFNKFKSNATLSEAQIKPVVEPVGSGMVVGSEEDAAPFGRSHNKMVTHDQDKFKSMPVVFVPLLPKIPRD
jgi:hypothetical protein